MELQEALNRGLTVYQPGHLLVNTRGELTFAEELEALQLLRIRIEHTPLKAVDSTTPGDKYTECSWGLCRSEGLYPDPNSHIWPTDFIERGRSAPLRHLTLCPMDKRDEGERFMGCFYHCRVFQAKKGQQPTRAEALELCDQAISLIKAKMKSTTENSVAAD